MDSIGVIIVRIILLIIIITDVIFLIVLTVKNRDHIFDLYAYSSFYGVLSPLKIRKRFEKVCKNINSDTMSQVILSTTKNEKYAHEFFEQYQNMIGSISNGRKLMAVDLVINADKSFSIIGTLTMSEDDILNNYQSNNSSFSLRSLGYVSATEYKEWPNIKTNVDIDILSGNYSNKCKIIHKA